MYDMRKNRHKQQSKKFVRSPPVPSKMTTFKAPSRRAICFQLRGSSEMLPSTHSPPRAYKSDIGGRTLPFWRPVCGEREGELPGEEGGLVLLSCQER